jgi:hypothetical protein
LWFDIHHHCHDHCTIIKRWRDAAPSICVGREVIGEEKEFYFKATY